MVSKQTFITHVKFVMRNLPSYKAEIEINYQYYFYLVHNGYISKRYVP